MKHNKYLYTFADKNYTYSTKKKKKRNKHVFPIIA